MLHPVELAVTFENSTSMTAIIRGTIGAEDVASGHIMTERVHAGRRCSTRATQSTLHAFISGASLARVRTAAVRSRGATLSDATQGTAGQNKNQAALRHRTLHDFEFCRLNVSFYDLRS